MNRIKEWFKNEWNETKVLLRSVPSWVLALFVVAVVGMNLLANKSIDTGSWTWLALDCGIVLSWLSFLTMDMIVKRFGAKASTKISIIAMFFSLIISLIFMLAASIPGFWGESYIEVGGDIVNVALNNTFRSSWYILLGSTIAFISSSLVNNLLNVTIGKLFKKNPDGFMAYATRSYVSTMIGQFVDNFVFSLIVSLNFFGWSFVQCLTCAITGAIVELLCQIIFTPIGYKVSKQWEEENVGNEYIALIKGDEK